MAVFNARRMERQTLKKVKGRECFMMEEIGHFPMSESPVILKKYLSPVLAKTPQNR